MIEPEYAYFQAQEQGQCKRVVVQIAYRDNSQIWCGSHRDVPAPLPITVDIVNLSLSSQSINPEDGSATTGGGSLHLLDYQYTLTEFLAAGYERGVDIHGATVTVWEGYARLGWASFVKRMTQQVHGEIDCDGCSYTLKLRPMSYRLNKTILAPRSGQLTTNINNGQMRVDWGIQGWPELMQHHADYSIDPARKVGYVLISDAKEVVMHELVSDNALGERPVQARGKFGTAVGSVEIYPTLKAGAVYVPVGFAYRIRLAEFNDKGPISYQIITAPAATVATAQVLQGNVIRVGGVQAGQQTAFSVRATHADGSTSDALIDIYVGNPDSYRHSPEYDARTQAKVEEYIYLEAHPAELAYMLLTGVDFSGEVLPSHWAVGLNESLIDKNCFTRLKALSPGLVLQLQQPGSSNARTFLQKEIFQLMRWSLIERPDGTLCLIDSPVENTACVATLGRADLQSTPVLTHTGDIYSQLDIRWGWNPISKKYANETFLDVPWTRDKYTGDEAIKPRTLQFKLLQPALHSERIINQLLLAHLAYYGQPRLVLPVKLLPSGSFLELADAVCVDISEANGCRAPVRDYTGRKFGIDRVFQVRSQELSVRGCPSATLVASRGEGLPETPLVGEVTVPDTAYQVGTQLSAGDYTVTGNRSIAPGVYWVGGTFTVAPNAVLSLSAPGTLKILSADGIEIFGAVDFYRQGASAGSAGPLGSTSSTGSINWHIDYVDAQGTDDDIPCGAIRSNTWDSGQGTTINGDAHSLNAFLPVLSNDNRLVGIPDEIHGTGGADGGDAARRHTCYGRPLLFEKEQDGGVGGAGGGGLITVAPQLIIGPDASVRLDGQDGGAGEFYSTLYSGAGAGGHPGGWLHVQTSNSQAPDISAITSTRLGDTPDQGDRPSSPVERRNKREARHSYFEGYVGRQMGMTRVAYIA